MELAQLEEISRQCRVSTLKSLRIAQSGHPGSSLSSMDVMVALYFGAILRHDPQRPDWDARDRFLLSVGHAVPGLYAVLAHAGFAPVTELDGLRKLGTGLEGHAKRGTYPGIEASSGSLGQGLSLGLGRALGLRRRESESQVYVLTSDGEQQEGSTWEAAMAASSQRVGNLVAIIDKNGNQINGSTKDIMPSLDPLGAKYEAFGWAVREINGNDMAEVVDALTWARDYADGPAAIVSNTQTGYPLSFMVGDYHWHHGVLDDEIFVRSMDELDEPVSHSQDSSWDLKAMAS